MRFVFLVLCGVFCFACSTDTVWNLSGKTMGTTYHITVIGRENPEKRDLSGAVRRRLSEINHSMSLFDDHSELSRFNRAGAGDAVCVSDDFRRVFEEGRRLFVLTGGAWDGTLAPLVNLWGFGSDRTDGAMPEEAALERIRSWVGYDRIAMNGEGCLIKTVAETALDFGSIAKGYAVDVICDLVIENGYPDCLVEIGGEVRTSGSKKGQPWVVGINTPRPDASADAVLTTLPLSGRAIATSGDYRNFKDRGGARYTHVIDPKNGKPVRNDVASVSVLADTAVFADGLATALMVMGEARGIALVEGLEGVDCLFILRDDAGGFRMSASSAWPIH